MSSKTFSSKGAAHWRSMSIAFYHQNLFDTPLPARQVNLDLLRIIDAKDTVHFHIAKVSTGLLKVLEDPDSLGK
jgi:hypothetical protein